MLEDAASPPRSQQLGAQEGPDGLANSGEEENDSGEQDEEAMWQDSQRDPVLAAKLYQAIQKEPHWYARRFHQINMGEMLCSKDDPRASRSATHI